MILSKKFRRVAFTILCILILSCSSNNPPGQNVSQCGEVSSRLMYSVVNAKYEELLINSNIDSTKKKVVGNLISKLKNINNELILEMGGFHIGKSLRMQNPCKNGEEVVIKIKSLKMGELYKKWIDILYQSGLISIGKYRNMEFIVESYFCSRECPFSNSNLKINSIGFLLLENLTLQLTILDLIMPNCS